MRYDQGHTYDSGFRYDSGDPPIVKPGKKAKMKTRRNWNKLPFADRLSRIGLIVAKNEANAEIPTPNAPYTALKATYEAAKATDAKIAAAEAELKALRTQRADESDAMVDAAYTFANHAEIVTDGDGAMLQRAALELLGDANNVPTVMTQVLNLVLSPGDTDGELNAVWDPVIAARVYEVQTSTNPTDPALWTTYDAPKSPSWLTLSGLTSGTRIWVRVRALGAGDQPPGPFRDPATKRCP